MPYMNAKSKVMAKVKVFEKYGKGQNIILVQPERIRHKEYACLILMVNQ